MSRNQRRTVSVAVAAVIVVGIVAGAALLAGREASAPAAPAPIRPAYVGPQVPVWYDAEGLHHGRRVEPTPIDLVAAGVDNGVLALVRGGALYRDPVTDDVWFHPWSGQPRVVGHSSASGPGGDPHSDVAVWFEDGELVVYDTFAGREISRTEERIVRPWAAREGMPGNGFRHVSTEEVVWRSGDDTLRLDVATGESNVIEEGRPDSPHSLEDVHAGTRVWEDLRLGGSFMTIRAAGQAERRFPELLTGRLSADGSFMLTPWGAGASDGPTVVDVRTGDRWVLPRAWSPSVIAWSYGDLALVLVHHDDTGGPLLACHAVERDCERLAHQGSVLLPTS